MDRDKFKNEFKIGDQITCDEWLTYSSRTTEVITGIKEDSFVTDFGEYGFGDQVWDLVCSKEYLD